MKKQHNDIINTKKQEIKEKQTILYLLVEEKTIATYEDKKEAEADMENHQLWYPENNYKVVKQENNINL